MALIPGCSPLRLILMALLAALLSAPGCKNVEEPEPQFDSFEEALDFLVERYVKMGAAIGTIEPGQEIREYYFGSLSENRPESPDSHSIFEIGSITKTFTATLLAQMVLEGKLSLDDPLDILLPDSVVNVPQWEGKRIRLKHLATQSSGLPRKPQDSRQPLPVDYDAQDPYAAYTTGLIYDYLSNWCSLEFEPGTRYLYSNTGMGLLGHVLGLRDSTAFRVLLTRELLQPLGMLETSLFLDEQQEKKLAPGHNSQMDSVKNYHAQDVLQGAGFLKSTLHDMLIYLQAQMGLLQTPLDEAIALSQQDHFQVGNVTYNDREGNYVLSLGLAWHIDLLPEGYTYYNHGGRTNGYMAHMTYDLEHGTGVVILCNQSQAGVIIRFGEDLLKALNEHTYK